MDRFFIRDGLAHKPASLDEWNEWHTKLNNRRDRRSRTVDRHMLTSGQYRIGVVTMFFGGPDANYMTAVTGYPGMQMFANTLGDAKTNHHAILEEAMASGWNLQSAYSPTPSEE